ncbi:MAG: response regulator [Magnetococcales bacterium]|nr:response regulator [Magnetococcales bacterium]
MKIEALSPKQVADLLGVSTQAVHKWVASGLLQAWRTPGGHRRITKASVDQLLCERDQQLMDSNPERRAVSVLVVDDDLRMHAVFQKHLHSWDMNLDVVTAKSGMDGFVQVAKKRPDLIITDLIMPDLDGFHMIQKLKDDPELRSIHIIVSTVLQTEEISRRGTLPDDVLVFQKPISFPKLKTVILGIISTIRTTSSSGINH